MTFSKILETSVVLVQFDFRLSCLTFLCASESRVLFSAHSNEKSCFCESWQLIIFLPLEFMRCIWGQLPPVRTSAFLCAQCGLSQLEGECMPGRLLPPHQPLPLLSLRLSFRVIHTQRESSSCHFSSAYSLLQTLSLRNRVTIRCSQSPLACLNTCNIYDLSLMLRMEHVPL